MESIAAQQVRPLDGRFLAGLCNLDV
jgi:hypothetical protein